MVLKTETPKEKIQVKFLAMVCTCVEELPAFEKLFQTMVMMEVTLVSLDDVEKLNTILIRF
jgi:hypothetical protein